MIGDAILFFLDENRVSLVGRPSAHNWVQFHGETGDYDVTLRARRAHRRQPDRQAQDLPLPGAGARRRIEVLTKANGGSLPEIKFFNMGELTIGGHKVRALHHGMSGVPGLELFGPWDEAEDVRAALVEAGADYGLAPGRLARLRDEHARVRLDPLPAAGRLHRRQDEGLPRVAARATGTRRPGSLGGSFYSDDISDYYLTPHDLGYAGFVKFDHDFIGKEALAGDGARRAAR